MRSPIPASCPELIADPVTAEPSLSVVIRVPHGPLLIRRSLESLVLALDGRDAEILVPYDTEMVPWIDALRDGFPSVRFLSAGRLSTPTPPGTPAAIHDRCDRLTSLAFRAAKGDLIAVLEDSVVPAPDWAERLLEAHRLLPHGVIGGAVEHDGSGSLNWALYFADFGRYGLPLTEGPADYLTDINVSYKRAALQAVSDVWAEKYNEATVHWALSRKGVTLWRRPQIVVRYDKGPLTYARALAERKAWGQLFGAVRTRELSPLKRLMLVVLTPGMPILLTFRTALKQLGARRHRLAWLGALPQLMLVTSAWCVGELLAYTSGREA